MSTSKVYPDHWQQPSPQLARLKVYNSLTRSKVEFESLKPNLITWYNCGPTVYDDSHMGHARNYLTQDILRRILRDYFGYNVHFVMNITDIDDKIILRARQNYLVSEYKAKHGSDSAVEIVATLQEAWQAYYASTMSKHRDSSSSQTPQDFIRALPNSGNLEQLKAKDPKFSMYFTALDGALSALTALSQNQTTVSNALGASESILGPYLDARSGSSVTDPAVFRALPAQMEQRFMDDMASLRIEPPTTLTRVTEYVPEIVNFVKRIADNGYAYSAQGSVYFDVAAFEANKERGDKEHHIYAKLQPWSKGDTQLLDEGEGALSSGTGKRAAADFALWKSSKPGEPAWDSPWGKGRPGWHIECSVMASEILGHAMDIHSGGIDLAFPHHDNELAQSEAYHQCGQWVNYFIHTGHLHIEGLKMSKSLKNFITIQEALQKHSARQLRLAFLLQPWHARMDFKESAMVEVRAKESLFDNFFANVKAILNKAARNGRQLSGEHAYGSAEKILTNDLHDTQVKVHLALCDSFDTPQAVESIAALVTQANTYINAGRAIGNTGPLEAVAQWVTRILWTFGLGEGSRDSDSQIGWGIAGSNSADTTDRATTLQPYLNAMSTFRDAIRKAGRGNTEIMQLCDKFRDDDLVDLGVALDDQPDGTALVKLVPREALLKAREEKQAAADAKAAKQEEKQRLATELAQRKAADAAKDLELGRILPQDWFRQQTDKFCAFDDEGFPTVDQAGEAISKSASKKLRKELEVQIKRHDKFLQSQNGSNGP